MRYLVIPDRGRVAVYSPAEIAFHRSFFTYSELDWQRRIASSVMPGACTGLFALVPHIFVYSARPRAGASSVQPYTIIEPGVCHGTELWEATVDDVIATLKQRGVYAYYEARVTSMIEMPILQQRAQEELRELQAKLALR